MASFGWAYINCEDSGSVTGGGQAAGPTGSLQFLTGTDATSGSGDLVYYTASYGGYPASTLIYSGTLVVTGTISASHFHIEDIATIDATGSTYFGDTDGDVHIRTGSFSVGASGSAIGTLETNATTNVVSFLGLRGSYTVVNATGQTSSADNYIYGVQAAGDVEFRLHSASTANSGALLIIKDEVPRVGAIIVSGAGGETIDGAGWYQMSGSYPSIGLYSNGENWFVF